MLLFIFRKSSKTSIYITFKLFQNGKLNIWIDFKKRTIHFIDFLNK